MKRLVATSAVAAGAVMLGILLYPEATRVPSPDKSGEIAAVAFIDGYEGDVCVVEERLGTEVFVSVVDVHTGARRARVPLPPPHDRTQGLLELLGGDHRGVWMRSRDLGLHLRDPYSGEITVPNARLGAQAPAPLNALRGRREGHFELAPDGDLLVRVEKDWYRLSATTLTARPLDAPPDRYHRRPNGTRRTSDRTVELSGGLSVRFETIPGTRQLDPSPVVVGPRGDRLPLKSLRYPGGRFLYDVVTDRPLAPASPPSVLAVHDGDRKLARAGLDGAEVWWTSIPRVAGDNAVNDERFRRVHVAGDALVVWTGLRIAGLKLVSGDVTWVYGSTSPAPLAAGG